MTHWLKSGWSGLGLGLLVLVTGCHIEEHNGELGAAPHDTCSALCLHLYDCGSLSGDAIGSCIDQCMPKLDADHERAVDGCDCVLDDECRALSDYHCPGAPLPTSPGGGNSMNSGGNGNASNGGATSSSGGASSGGGGATSSSGGTSSSSGGTSSSSGGAPLDCQGGYDCAADEDCVDGACRQRCSASCQCPTDLSCVDHYCRSSAPPPMCTVDCECAAGQHCLNGSCG